MLQDPQAPEMPVAGPLVFTETPAAEPAPAPSDAQRLIITRMVLNNFKSYAGTQTIGPFHKSFSSVVGPNGSGKSNVIDSLLFVFGYRANKMRQGKLSELIHSSQAHQKLDSCSVEVHFCEIRDLSGPDAYETVPDSDLVVSRVAFRNNSSKYYINGRTSTFTEVTTLLKSKGVDLDHKRFLILQGEVESISQMKPKAQSEHEEGLLEYLEDIIGTSKYKEPIDESGKQLDQFNDDRAERLNRVKIAERERNGLEGKKDEAESYLRDENELVQKLSCMLQRQIHDQTIRVAQSEVTFNQVNDQLQSELAKFAEFRSELHTLENGHQLAVREYEAARKAAAEITNELNQFEREDVQLQENREFLKRKVKKVETACQKDTLTLSELETTIKNNHSDMERGQQELAQMDAQQEKEEQVLVEIVEGLKGKTEVFSQQIEEHQNKLAPWVEKINAEQSQLDIAESEFKLLEDKCQASEKQIILAQTGIEETEQQQVQKAAEIQANQKKLKELRRKHQELLQTVKDTETQETDFRSDVTKARQKLDEARTSLEKFQTRGKVLQGLLRMKETGRIEGIHNRLGSLGVIDDKYDVAISTCCPSLDNIVVDDVPSAQKCIEHLRKNSLGRAVFIVLTQLTAKPTPPPNTPEGVPRLFDLVQPKDARYAPAFYHALRDTLVAADLDQANRIAFGGSGGRRWRVVTLNGQLIETSGAMSGGGTRVHSGLMSSRFTVDDVTPETVAVLERKCAKVEAEWKQFSALRSEMVVEAQMIEKELPGLETGNSKLTMEVEALQQQRQTLAERIATLQEDDQPDRADVDRMQALQTQIAGHRGRLSELCEKRETIKDEIKKLQDKILEIGGVQLRVQKAKVKSLKERIETCQDLIIKLDVAAKKAAKDHSKVEKAIERQQRELADTGVQIDKLGAEIERKTHAALEVKVRCDKATRLQEDKQQCRDELKAELDEKTAEYNQVRASEVNLKHSAEEAERHHADNIKRLNYLQGERSRLSLQQVGDQGGEQVLELPTLSPEELATIDVPRLKQETEQLRAKLERTKPNLSVLAEYHQRQKECQARTQDLDEITAHRDEAKRRYDDLRKNRLDEFMEGFNIISYKLKEMYQ
ncbi:Structural maintenance of chromosomes protein 4, partial [Tieghemiomyces parasiticus]